MQLHNLIFGAAYSNGEGVEKDKKIAYEWFRRAAEQGNMGAKEQLELVSNRGVVEAQAALISLSVDNQEN